MPASNWSHAVGCEHCGSCTQSAQCYHQCVHIAPVRCSRTRRCAVRLPAAAVADRPSACWCCSTTRSCQWTAGACGMRCAALLCATQPSTTPQALPGPPPLVWNQPCSQVRPVMGPALALVALAPAWPACCTPCAAHEGCMVTPPTTTKSMVCLGAPWLMRSSAATRSSTPAPRTDGGAACSWQPAGAADHTGLHGAFSHARAGAASACAEARAVQQRGFCLLRHLVAPRRAQPPGPGRQACNPVRAA